MEIARIYNPTRESPPLSLSCLLPATLEGSVAGADLTISVLIVVKGFSSSIVGAPPKTPKFIERSALLEIDPLAGCFA